MHPPGATKSLRSELSFITMDPGSLRLDQMSDSDSTQSSKESSCNSVKSVDVVLQNTEDLQSLAATLSSLDAAFYCGGNEMMSNTDTNIYASIGVDQTPTICRPVTLRWDFVDGSIGRITFPPSFPGDAHEVLSSLLRSYTPASFGVGGKEVMDESYRKAVKLDVDQFCTNFNPYDCGIIDAISQTLLPEIASRGRYVEKGLEDHLGVVAELYKLNVSTTSPNAWRTANDLEAPNADLQTY